DHAPRRGFKEDRNVSARILSVDAEAIGRLGIAIESVARLAKRNVARYPRSVVAFALGIAGRQMTAQHHGRTNHVPSWVAENLPLELLTVLKVNLKDADQLAAVAAPADG